VTAGQQTPSGDRPSAAPQPTPGPVLQAQIPYLRTLNVHHIHKPSSH